MTVCPSGKRNYTKKGAKRALRLLLSTGHDPRPHSGFHPYRCPDCSWWHLGHPSPRWKAAQNA